MLRDFIHLVYLVYFPDFGGVFCLPTGSLSEAMYTLYRTAFAPAQKPWRVRLLFTLKNGDFDATSVTEGSCTVRIS